MEKIKNDFSLIAILLIPVSIAINIVGFQIAQMLRLPIFLDTIGTILIGLLAGPWVAAITGLLTNLINGIFNPVYLAYIPTAMVIGIAAGYLSKFKMTQGLIKMVISGIIITLVVTIVSAPITVLVFGGATGNTSSAITAVFLASGQQIWGAVFSSTIITEFIDKILSVVISALIVKGMSSRYLSKFKYGNLYLKKQK